VLISVFKTANTALEPALQVLPHPLDYALVVVTVGKIVIQRGEAVLLASLLHTFQLIAIKCELVDVAPTPAPVGPPAKLQSAADSAFGR
jgi:hypothetical protein